MTTTPRPNIRRPLGSLTGNGHNLQQESPEREKREFAHKASLSALTGKTTATPATRRQSSGIMDDNLESIEVGDIVGVPGGMTGIVKFLGAVNGKKGTFAGVELSREYAARGKNDGDVDGVRYFTTSIPGAGIFLPSHRASKQASPSLSASTSGFPRTPTTPAFTKLDYDRKETNSSRTPPSQSIPKFSQSLGPGARHPFSQTMGPTARAPSPQLKPKSRPSLPRPESPFRKPPTIAPSTAGRGTVRGMRPSGMSTPSAVKAAKPSTPAPARSPSRSQSRQGQVTQPHSNDTTPTSMIRPKMSMRGISSQQSTTSDAEVQRLRKEAEDKDEQLKEQTSALAEMENQLAELSSLVATTSAEKQSSDTLDAGTEGKDVNELRSMLRAKQDKIDQMTKEFDFHRADFRSTIDALETAATHTQEIYEKREKELVKEIEELQNGKEDVEQFQEQYKQFEEAVAELEEAVENARRGEAEAKAESEFLHGEVERVRLELKREREKAANAVMGANAAIGESGAFSPDSSQDRGHRESEIQGLKAIIKKLNEDANLASPESRGSTLDADTERTFQAQISALSRERSELQGLIDRKNFREDELERENARLRSANGMPNDYGNYAARSHAPNGLSHHHTDSASNATMHTANRNSATSTGTAFRPSTRASFTTPPQTSSRPGSGTMQRPKSGTAERPTSRSWAEHKAANEGEREDDASTTEGSEATGEIFCDFCQTDGHDILKCEMFGGGDDVVGATNGDQKEEDEDTAVVEDEAAGATPRPKRNDASFAARAGSSREEVKESQSSAPVAVKEETAQPVQPATTTLPPLSSTEPAPGKASGVIDLKLSCGMCERDGHNSWDCPYEEEY